MPRRVEPYDVRALPINGAYFVIRYDALLRKYAISQEGLIHFIQTSLERGRFHVEILNYRGEPQGSRVMSAKQLEGMTLHNELRSARAFAAAQAKKYELLQTR
jgi:hypothetical protein